MLMTLESFRPYSIHSEINAICVIEKCIADVRSWLIANRLMINDSKTEFLIIGTRQQLETTSIESIIVGDTVIKPLESVQNLGSWFDAHMRMNVHIGKICSKAFRGQYNIRQIRKFLRECSLFILGGGGGGVQEKFEVLPWGDH